LGYKPTKKVAEILNWCLQKIQSVPYKVSLRWIFYRAVQERGLTKKDYGNFKKWTARARKNFWNGWRPDTIIDDTREIYWRGFGWPTPEEWFKSFWDRECVLDKWKAQPRIVIVLFEAEAMYRQFEHYASPFHVSLAPFKGDYSIQKKWELAKSIERLSQEYGKPVVLLYFGDLDPKGLQIPESALRDIRAWCNVPFEFRRIGLTKEHVERWKLPENPEKPGEYQWEALPDEAARELIVGALEEVMDVEALRKVEEEEREATEKWRKMLERLSSEEA